MLHICSSVCPVVQPLDAAAFTSVGSTASSSCAREHVARGRPPGTSCMSSLVVFLIMFLVWRQVNIDFSIRNYFFCWICTNVQRLCKFRRHLDDIQWSHRKSNMLFAKKNFRWHSGNIQWSYWISVCFFWKNEVQVRSFEKYMFDYCQCFSVLTAVTNKQTCAWFNMLRLHNIETDHIKWNHSEWLTQMQQVPMNISQ